MSKEFCKILNHDEIGQVVVMKDNDEDCNPIITVTIAPDSKTIGNVKATLLFKDEQMRDRAYDGLSVDFYNNVANELHLTTRKLENEND